MGHVSPIIASGAPNQFAKCLGIASMTRTVGFGEERSSGGRLIVGYFGNMIGSRLRARVAPMRRGVGKEHRRERPAVR